MTSAVFCGNTGIFGTWSITISTAARSLARAPMSRMVPAASLLFSSRRRLTRCSRDWSSDVCSCDLPGGRVFIDGLSLCCDEGWQVFEAHRKAFSPLAGPPHITKASTPQELETYLRRAGFLEQIGRASCRERV